MPKPIKITTFPRLLDLLIPHSCRGCGRIGKPLCDCCKKNIIISHFHICPNCKTKISSDRCKNCQNLPPIYLVGEKNDVIGALIHDLKFNSNRALAFSLAKILDQILPTINGPVKIVPLPTISKHIRERGLDHTYLISKHLAKIRGQSYHTEKILLRNCDTVQVGTNKKARLKQASVAYKINEKATLDKNATYVLLDDVWTTGASMKSALKKLQDFGANKIIIAVLALSSLD